MRRNTLNKVLIVCCLLVMVSCKAKKQMVAAPAAVATPPPAIDNTKANKLADIKARQLVFNTFSGRASTRLGINNDSKDVTLNIRINKDKQIWVSITATVLITIEVARAVITPDSIKIINKLQGVYVKKPFSYIHAFASKQVNYKMLESLLVGNAAPGLLTEKADVQVANGNITLAGNLEELIYKLLLGPDMKVAQFNLSNQAQAQSLQVNNSEFVQVDNRIVPSQIAISSVSKDKKIQANLHYTKIELDQQLEYPFNIPETYTPAN
jgi:hypothetical protein